MNKLNDGQNSSLIIKTKHLYSTYYAVTTVPKSDTVIIQYYPKRTNYSETRFMKPGFAKQIHTSFPIIITIFDHIIQHPGRPLSSAPPQRQNSATPRQKAEWEIYIYIFIYIDTFSSRAFGREFLFGLIKIAKQKSEFAYMVISQLKHLKCKFSDP